MAATSLKSDSLVKKNFFKICLLAFAGSIIYGLPYFRYYYYDAYLAAYGLNNSQMGTLGGAYGVLGLFSYLIDEILQLSPGVELQGPWPVDADLRRFMDLPEWASQIMILECEP